MRSRLIPLVAVLLLGACADAPTSPAGLLTAPANANFFTFGDPPPPWAQVEGSIETATGSISYVGAFFANKPGNVAWLKFTRGIGGTFTPNARIMSVNGKVTGTGSFTVGGTQYQLSSVRTFAYNGDCAGLTGGEVDVARIGSSCGSFAAGDEFSSASATWNGQMANDRLKRTGKPGDGDVCLPETGC